MTRKARRRAAAAALLALIVGGLLSYGHYSGTLAIFSADTENQNSTFVGDYLTPASGFNTPVASGNGEYFTWTVGHDAANQEVWFADQGTTANCTGASYTNSLYSGGTALGSGVSSIDGANSGTSSDVPAANVGDYICYQIRTTNGPWTTAVANVGTAVQVGLVPTSIVWSGAGSGQLSNGQTIVIHYNQTIAYGGAASISVTATNASTLTLTGIGVLSGGTISNGVGNSCSNSGVAASGSGAASILTITLGGCPTSGGNRIKPTAGSGPPRYTGSGANPTSTIGPAGHAYSVGQCTNATGNRCTPAMTY